MSSSQRLRARGVAVVEDPVDDPREEGRAAVVHIPAAVRAPTVVMVVAAEILAPLIRGHAADDIELFEI